MKVKSNINALAQKSAIPKGSTTPVEHALISSPLPTLICRPDGNIILSNAAAASLLGIEKEQLHYTSIQSVFNNPQLKLNSPCHTSQPTLLNFPRSSGCPLLFESYFNYIIDEDEQKVQVSLIDITENEKLKQEASQYEFDLSLFINNSEELLMLVDKHHKVILFNQVMAQRTRLKRGIELKKGLNVLDLADADEREHVKGYYQKAFSGETIAFEMQINVEGKPYYYFCSFKPARTGDGNIPAVLVTTRDITEKKLHEVALTNAEQRWRFALEGSNQGVWDWDIAKETVFFSDSWKKLFGFGPDEVFDSMNDWQKMLHPLDKISMEQHIKKHFETDNDLYETEFRARSKEGFYKWILSKGMIVSRDAVGTPLRMLGTHIDITERKAIEESFRLMFYDNPRPMWTFDKKTFQFLDVNNIAIELYGYSRQEFLQMSILDIRPQEDVKRVKELVGRKGYIGSRKRIWRHLKKNGDLIDVEITTKYFDRDGLEYGLVLAEDVTDKVRSEKKLRDSELQYKLLFDDNPLPFWIYDPATLKFLEVNTAALDFYGYTREEFLNLALFDLYLPEDIDRIKKVISKVSENGHAIVNTWTQKKKNGDLVTVEVSRNELQYHSVSARLVVIRDITERVRAKKLLEQSEQQYRALFHHNPLPSFIYNPADFSILEVNDVMVNAYGYSREELLSLKLPDLIPTKELERLQAIVKNKDGSNLPVVSNWTHLKKNGDKMIVEVIRNTMDYNGVPARLVIVKDVTERVKIEKQIRETNERYQLATRATSDVVYDWDLANNKLDWNENILTILGWNPGFLTIDKWKEMIHENERESVVKSIQEFISHPSKNHWRFEYNLKTADGGYKYVLDRGFLLRDSAGTPIRMIGAMQDITDIKQKEKELLKSNDRFKFVSQATSDTICDWDLKKGEIILSENYQQIFGWELPDTRVLTPEVVMDRCHPDDKQQILSSINEAINSSKTIFDAEFRYLRGDGTYAFATQKCLILRDDHGVAERIIGAMQDISERKYQEELQTLELRVFEVSAVPGVHIHTVLQTLIKGYEELHNEMTACISIVNVNDEIEILAPRLGKDHARQLKYYIERQKDKLQTNPLPQNELIISYAGGDEWKHTTSSANSFAWKTSWTHPVYHHNGSLLAFITIFVDGERKPSGMEVNTLSRLHNLLRVIIVNYLSLEQIRLSNERYNNVLKATHDLVWDWNLETGSFYRNIEGLKKVYGIDNHEAIQNVYSWMERIHPEDHSKVQQVINDILHATDQDTFDVEYRFKKDDGNYSFIYDRGVIVRNADGKPLRMIGAAQNVTDRKILEDELLQKELDRQKSISQATIDTQEEERREIGKELHDNVNQVLTTTKLYLDLSLSSPELKDDLIKKSSKNIIYVINEIRQLSRSLMDPSIGDLGLIDSINDLVENINITRKLHVSLSADPELENLVDESQKLMIFRILQEAMNNTIKYAQATAVQLSLRNKKGQVELIISDDGVGFNPKTIKKGAGLKNIQNRVYLTGGKLQIDTAAGKGCNIIIHFPIQKIK
ncbi:MAG TPA: PAS domain S-box protein [Chitinophagaceae bacterium]|nr:PAS domain S-box protein [Chitinophagaceae bacterium]